MLQNQALNDSIQYEANKEPGAECPIVDKAEGNKPQRPGIGRVFGRGGCGTRLTVHTPGQAQPPNSYEYKQEQGGKEADEDEVAYKQILGEHDTNGQIASVSFSQDNGQGANVFGFIGLVFVYVFAKDDRCGAKGIGQADKHYLPIPNAGDDVVSSGDHEWSPNDDDGDFTEANVFEWPGVKEDEEDTSSQQGECEAAAPIYEDEASSKGNEAGDKGVDDGLAEGEQAVFDGLDAVLGAEVVALVGSFPGVGDVVDDVVGGVCHDEADGEE